MGSVESVESVGSVESVESACPVGQDWPYPRIRGKDSQEKVSKKRFLQGSQDTQNYMVVVPAGFASQGFSRFPRLHTLYRSPQTSQVRVPK